MRRAASKELIADEKDETLLIRRMEQFIQKREIEDTSRRDDIIHPSELCRPDFCDRAVYLRIIGAPAKRPAEIQKAHFLRILAEGSDIHTKHQTALWDMGELIGMFECLLCRHEYDTLLTSDEYRWWDKAPTHCRRCGASRRYLRYKEVPVDGVEEYLIAGHADGRQAMRLLEIKSVGKGTVRIESPDIYKRHTHKVEINGKTKEWVDLDGIWRSINRPFLVHTLQGQLYLHLTGLDEILFIYEAKWNQSLKEFRVTYHFDLIEPLIDRALDIRYAVQKTHRTPRCPHGGCAACQAYEEPEPDAA